MFVFVIPALSLIIYFFPVHFASAALTDGLVGHWTFDGKDTIWTGATTGTTLDKSGNGNTGTLTNMNRATSPASGKLGQGLNFDGASDYVNITGSAAIADNLPNFTVSAWFKTTTTHTEMGGQIISKLGPGGYLSGRGWSLQLSGPDRGIGSSHVDALIQTDGSNWRGRYSIGSYNDGKWHHAVMVVTGGNSVVLYVNGSTAGTAQDDSGTMGTYANTSEIRLGSNTSSEDFDGIIDDARIYNRALSATEIQQLYKQGATKLGVTPSRTASSTGLNSGLVGYWTFDGKDTIWTGATTGTTLDKSGNGKTGTLTSLSRATSTVPGKIGQGLNFLGARGRVAITGPILTSTVPNGFSIFVWMKTTDTSAYVIEQDGSDALTLKTNAAGTACRIINSTGGAVATPSGGTGNDGKWHQVGCVLDRATNALIMYVDGASTTSAGASNFDSFNGYAGNFYVGERLYGGTSGIAGTLDDFRVYNRALSATEIAQLYKQGATKLGVTPSRTASSTGLNSGLVGHWTFDGKDTIWTGATTGTTLDKSGNGNTGTLQGLGRATSTVPGKLGQGLRFADATYTGLLTGVVINHTSEIDFDNSESFTVSAWFKVDDLSTAKNLFAKANFSNIGYHCYLSAGENFLRCRLRNGGSVGEVSSPSIVSNRWYHLVWTVDATGNGIGTAYINGVSGVPGTLNDVNASSSANLVVGCSAIGTPACYKGSIDEVRLFNRVLTTTEIQQLYKLGQNKNR